MMPMEKPSPSRWLFLFLCGICMGAADLVPGISGGTIAFMMGFYDELLESIKTLNGFSLKLFFSGQWRAFFQFVAWKFLLILLAGIIFSFISLAGLFHFILEHEIYRTYLYSSFLGIILASFFFCLRQINEWSSIQVIGLVCGAILAYVGTGSSLLSESKGFYGVKIQLDLNRSVKNYDAQQGVLKDLSKATLSAMLAKEIVHRDAEVYDNQGRVIGQVKDFIVPYQNYPLDLWLSLCGTLAVCALLLPGISGSYLLTLLGVYSLVIGALADLVSSLKHLAFDKDAFFILFSLGSGMIVGLMIFSRGVSYLLKHYPNFTLAVLVGFMIGAIRSVWPFWSYEYTLLPLKMHKGPHLTILEPIWPPLGPSALYALLCASGGFLLIFAMDYLVNQTQVNNKLRIKIGHEQAL